MRSFSVKLRLIYFPFLLTAAGFVLGYSILNAWLTIATSAISWKEPVTDLWGPLILPIIPLAIWLRPRIKLLSLKSRRIDLLFLYLIVASLAIGLPTILLQGYLRTSMGRLTSLQSIDKIAQIKPTKYYAAKIFYIDTAAASFENTATSGWKGGSPKFTIYIACPIFNTKPLVDTGAAARRLAPQAWACLKYTRGLSNGLSASEKREKWQDFVLATLEDFHHKDLSRLIYLDRMGDNWDREYYERAIFKSTYVTTMPRPLLILEPRFTAFEARNRNALSWVFGVFLIGALVWLGMLAIPRLDGDLS